MLLTFILDANEFEDMKGSTIIVIALIWIRSDAWPRNVIFILVGVIND